MRRVLLLIAILMLSACARQPEAMLPMAWARADGQPVNPPLLDIDSLSCKDEMQKPDGETSDKVDNGRHSQAMVDNFISCMGAQGYVQIKS